MIIKNIKGYTLAQPEDKFHSIKIKDGYISQIAKDSDSLTEDGKVIDGQGLTLLPGFHDAHIHAMSLGKQLRLFDLNRINNDQHLKDAYSSYRKKLKNENPFSFIQGRGVNLQNWQSGTFSLTTLDQIEQEFPLVIKSVDGHSCIANTIALEKKGILNRFPQGILVDDDMAFFDDVFADKKEDLLNDFKQAQHILIEKGITSIDEAYVGDEALNAFLYLDQKQRLQIRCNLWLGGLGTLQKYLKYEPKPVQSEMLNIRSVKFFTDGALGSGGAFTSFPQKENDFGLELMTLEELISSTREVIKAQFQPVYHVIGNRAVNNVLQALEQLSKEMDIGAVRPRLEHIQILNSDDLKLFDRLPIIASMQPCHYTTDEPWLFKKFPFLKGEEFQMYPWKTLLNLKERVVMGTDAPVEDPDVFANLQSAITARDDGEQLSLFEVIKGYTGDASYANFIEEKQGKLLPGFRADIVMLSEDPFHLSIDDLSKTRVEGTMTAGKLLFSRGQI